jgi:gluconolactonase
MQRKSIIRELKVKLSIDLVDPVLLKLVEMDQDLELVAEGFSFIEGPVWHDESETLTFNDIPESITYRWHPATGVVALRINTNKANGNAIDHENHLIVCEHATSQVIRTDLDGKHAKVLASHYQGKELNSPNDIIVSNDGTLWFTDPFFGRNPSRVGVPRQQELDFQGVYRLDPVTGELTLVIDDLLNPNGLCFSPDESVFYVNDSPNDLIRAYDVGPGYTLQNARQFASTSGDGPGHPDGLKVDQDGYVYCAAQGGIHIFKQDGTFIGRIQIPGQSANFCFGDRDLKSIYIAASDRLFRIRTKVAGNRVGLNKEP